jgi:hypothetical protein
MVLKLPMPPLSEYDQDLAKKGLRRIYRGESVANSPGVCYREVIVPIEGKKKPRKRRNAGLKDDE